MVEKTIQLNPEFLSLTGNVKKNKTKKTKPNVPNSKNKTKDLRKKFIDRIKQHQQKNSSGEKKQTAIVNSNDDFLNSLEYLEQINKQKKLNKLKTKSNSQKNTSQNISNKDNSSSQASVSQLQNPIPQLQNPIPQLQNPIPQLQNPIPQLQNPIPQLQNSPPIPIMTTPFMENSSVIKPNVTISNGLNNNVPIMAGGSMSIKTDTINGAEIKKPVDEPLYGNLKGGKKPTYRTLKNGINYKQTNNKTKTSAGNEKTNVTIEILEKEDDNKDNFNTRSEKLQELKNKAKKKTSITKTLHKLGKHKKTGKIGVLIKDRHTRRRIKDDFGKLKQKSLLEIQNSLKKQNLLKGGSNAPSDVIRELYENAMLAGDINNKSCDTLVHNYLSESNPL